MMPSRQVGSQLRFLKGIDHNLRLLQSDLQLQQLGYRLVHAVDFSAMFDYAYQGFVPGRLLAIPDETEERTYARYQVALQLLFGGSLAELLLIAPYATELRNHLRLIDFDTQLANAALRSDYRQRLRNLLENSNEFRRIIEQVTPEETDIKDAERMELIKLGKLFFPELYAVAKHLATDAVGTFKALLGNRVIGDAEELLPYMKGFSQRANASRIEYWYDKIRRARRVDRPFQSLIDAMACTYIERANQEIEKERIIVLFAAPSYRIDVLFAPEHLHISGVDGVVSPVRDLTYFLLKAVYRQQESELRPAMAVIHEVLLALDALQAGGVQSLDETADGISLEAAEQSWKICENLRMMLEMPQVALQHRHQTQNVHDRRFVTLMRNLYSATQREREDLEAQIGTTLEALRANVGEVSRMMPSGSDVADIIDATIAAKGGNVYITLPGLLGEVPVVISFRHTSVQDLAQQFRKARTLAAKEAFGTVLSELRAATQDVHTEADYRLLTAYIAAATGKYSAALEEIAAGLQHAVGAARIEMLYCAIVIHRVQREYEAARSLINEAMSLQERDPRLLLEDARLKWHEWYKLGAKDAHILEQASSRARLAKEMAEGGANEELRFQSTLFLSFINSELALHEGSGTDLRLECARQYLVEIEGAYLAMRTEPERERRIHYVKGWYLFASAVSTPKVTSVRRRLLKRALREMKDGVREDGSRSLLEIGSVHMAMIESELAKVPGGKSME